METPNLYSAKKSFKLGGSQVIKSSKQDKVTIIAAGITVHETLAAYEELSQKGIFIQVIDAYSIQPLDVKTLTKAAKETKGRVIVVEDHYAAGGLGEAVGMALSGMARITHLCIREKPRSGKPRELMKLYGISREAVVKEVENMVKGRK